MRKIFSVVTFLFGGQLLFAQTDSVANYSDSARSNYHESIFNYLSFSGGQFQANFSNLNSQLKTWGATKTFSPYTTLGISFRGNIVLANFDGDFDGCTSLEWLLPQDVYIGDSMNFHLHGWHLVTSFYGIDIIDKKHFTLVAAPGVDWGKIKILQTWNGVKTHYNNPFAAPFLRVETRFMFWKLMLGARVLYHFEFTNPEWVPEEIHRNSLPDSRISGWGFQFFLGLHLRSN